MNEYQREKRMKYITIDKLGDMFRWGYENDYYYDEECKGYMDEDSGGSDAFRIVYLTMLYEQLIGENEERKIKAAVAWHDPDNLTFRKDVVAAFLNLSICKYNDIDTVEKLIDYLNQYTVNPLIRVDGNPIFHAVCFNGYIANHQLIYTGGDKKGIWDDLYKDDHLYKLNLGCELTGADGNKIWSESFKQNPPIHCDKEEIVEIDSDVRIVYGHTRGGDWIHYVKADPKDPKKQGKFIAYNINTGKRIEYKGAAIAHDEEVVILQHKSVLYRVEGNEIKEIYRLGKDIPEYVDTESVSYNGSKNRILIAPAIRGQFVPYIIDFNGNFVEQDCSMAKYMWYTAISLDYILSNKKDIDYDDLCYDQFMYPKGEVYDKFHLEGDAITFNSVMAFAKKYNDSERELLDSMHPFIRLILVLGQVMDHDMDLSNLLCAIRNDFIKTDQEYWDTLTDMFYSTSDDKSETVDRDVLSYRFGDGYRIEYRYNQFVSMEYVDKCVLESFLEGKLEDYIEEVWFKNE